ncbi:MAG: BolA/IbaG family iron-sulfur metabolism protein [Moraxellaceae bacterium]|nr:BolA/IbaG family iron-sulfur metabolism protein [Moraxellaceae bacterium]
MNTEKLIEFLQPHFPNGIIQTGGQGTKFDVRVVDDSFIGKRQVQRQQVVYALVNDFIASGEIHALNIQALTHKEWQEKQQINFNLKR